MLKKIQNNEEVSVRLTDPVCGMEVSKNSEHHFHHGGEDFYFCSSGCHDKFAASPGEYASAENNADDEQLKDPVCGMNVTADSDFHLQHDDKEYYFCSSGCHHKFQTEPDKYLNPKEEDASAPADAASSASATYTCPMHPEVEQQGSGACPKCGMALEPKGLPVIETRTEYTCPMHPEIVQDEPGACPKCGMALEARTVEAEEDTSELDYMSKHFWVSAALAIPVLFSAMAAEFWPLGMAELIDPSLR